MGVQSVLGGDVAWHVEYDKAPSAILEHHWPTVPNYGAITTVDWSKVEPVDIITGGFPCQDLSLAGRRAGMRAGTRSGLWSDYLKAIDVLRPRLAVIENVRGLLSGCAESDADSDLGPCPRCAGDSGARHAPNVRALGRVLIDLAGIGYDARWVGLRAADAGAPHNRFRVFVLAYPKRGGDLVGHGSDALGGWAGETEQARLGDRAAADTRRHEPERRGGLLDMGSPQGGDEGTRQERQWVRNPLGNRGAASPDPSGERLGEHPGAAPSEEAGARDSDKPASDRGSRPDLDWGPYRPAIERWESILGRFAPAATRRDGRAGAARLNPEFVEWMMGLPAGHVTDPVIGLSRNEQLKALGNGVVPQQCELAVGLLVGQAPHSSERGTP